MTTIAYSKPERMIAADSRNTDSAGTTYLVEKIDKLPHGWYFLGAGHLLTIGMARAWAAEEFLPSSKPDFSLLMDPDSGDGFAFSCLVVSPDGDRVILIDDETHPTEVFDDYVAVGSGAAYAIGAMMAGASAKKAVEIAVEKDGNSGGPVVTKSLKSSRK